MLPSQAAKLAEGGTTSREELDAINTAEPINSPEKPSKRFEAAGDTVRKRGVETPVHDNEGVRTGTDHAALAIFPEEGVYAVITARFARDARAADSAPESLRSVSANWYSGVENGRPSVDYEYLAAYSVDALQVADENPNEAPLRKLGLLEVAIDSAENVWEEQTEDAA